MSLYIFDTDVMSLFQQGHSSVSQRLLICWPRELATTVISVEEQLTGWYTALRRARRSPELVRIYQRIAETVQFYSGIEIISFSEHSVAIYDNLRSQRLNIGKMDLRIAAITLEHDACLVTRNIRDFQRVPGLQIEDWTI